MTFKNWKYPIFECPQSSYLTWYQKILLGRLFGYKNLLNFNCLTMKFHNCHHTIQQSCDFFVWELSVGFHGNKMPNWSHENFFRFWWDGYPETSWKVLLKFVRATSNTFQANWRWVSLGLLSKKICCNLWPLLPTKLSCCTFQGIV